MSSSNVLEFLMLIGKLKTEKRTGWVNHGVKLPESVSDHMYRMAVMTFLLRGNDNRNNRNIDSTRCLKIALVHDLAECIVGDITPFEGISKEEKHKKEKEAMEHLVTLVDQEAGKELLELWKEYEEQSTDEAHIVKDFDRFEMILQAFEYETGENRPGELQDFFNSTEGKFQSPTVKSWVDELNRRRSKATESSSSG